MQVKRFAISAIRALGFAATTLAALPAAAQMAVPSQPGTARVWFLRPGGEASLNAAAAPEIYANGAPVGSLTAGTMFSRDFPAGTYSFTVQPYGMPTREAATLSLTPGEQAYLEVTRVGSWQYGQPEGSFSSRPNTFAVVPMAPQLAQAFLPTLTYVNAR